MGAEDIARLREGGGVRDGSVVRACLTFLVAQVWFVVCALSWMAGWMAGWLDGWLGEIFPGERDFRFRDFEVSGVQFSYSFTRRDMNKCLLRSKTKILLQVPTLGVLKLGQKKGYGLAIFYITMGKLLTAPT